MGRIDQGLFSVQRTQLDLVPLVRDAAAAIALPDRTIAVDSPGELILEGDAPKLWQAIDNVLSNSVRYTPSGGTVRVALRFDATAEMAVVDIADRGPGMDTAVAARVFTRFAHGPDSHGLGLGLYLAREIRARARWLAGGRDSAGTRVDVHAETAAARFVTAASGRGWEEP